MTRKTQAPYAHYDGSPCWTIGCKRGNDQLEQHLTRRPFATPNTVMMTLARIAQQHVPRSFDQSYEDYYNATDRKHFGNRTEPGSKFLDPALQKLEHVLMLRMRQTGQHNLDGEDREALIRRGSDPEGFMEGNRYLMVLTHGTVGVTHSTRIPNGTRLQVMRTKPGVPCSLVLNVEEQPRTDYGVLILSEHEVTGQDLLITAFPGPVTKPTISEELDNMEGQRVTARDAKRILGGEFWANTRINQ